MYYTGCDNMHGGLGGALLERTKLYIYSGNIRYGERLSRFISGRNNPDFDVELLTELKDRIEPEQDACVVTDDEDACKRFRCRVIRLVKTPEAAGEHDIFMYQGGDQIYRQIMRITGRNVTERNEELSLPKVVCVFSPGESDEKTVFALRAARDRAERGSVLYMSLCGFPVFFGEEMGDGLPARREGISELMLCGDPDIFQEKLAELAFPLGQLMVLAPARHFRDLLDFTTEEVKKFVMHLRQQTLFDAVIIETGQLMEATFSLLSEADAVFVPEETGVFGEVRRQVFRDYCIREGREALWQQCYFFPLTDDMPSDWQQIRQLICDKEVGVE